MDNMTTKNPKDSLLSKKNRPHAMVEFKGVPFVKTSEKDRPTIGLDIDGVLCNMVGSVVKYINSTYAYVLPKPLDWSEIDAWNIPILDTTLGAIIKQLQRTPGFLKSLNTYTDASLITSQLISKFNISLITDRPLECAYETRLWLYENKIYYHSLYFTEHCPKYYVDDIEVLVDDRPEHIHAYLEHTEGLGILMVNPWNFKQIQEFEKYSDKFVFSSFLRNLKHILLDYYDTKERGL